MRSTQGELMTDATPIELAETYFDAWTTGDAERLRAILTDDVTFAGPMGTANGIDECIAGLQGMAKMIKDLLVHKRVADESDVMTWYDLVTESGALPTVNWSHIENGRISAIRATFDPRPLLGG
jgi:ketosteroid isomerase-like protein